MKFIDPSFDILTDISSGGIKELQHIERCGRISYRSEDKITEDGESAKKFVAMLIKNGHESVLEHGSLTVEFTVDRAIANELVRHRLASFTQESTRYCLAGNTILTTSNPHNRPTIEELYNKKLNGLMHSVKRMNIRQYNEETGELVYAHIRDIYYNGTRETIKIKTRLGYEVVCTPDHLIRTSYGYMEAGAILVGSDILVNGSNEFWKNYDWLYHQNIDLNKTFVQISNETGVNVSTLKKWARKLGIPKKGTGYFNSGRTPWNKGIQVDAQVNALRQYHHCGRRNDHILKHDTSNYWKHKKSYCELCGNTDINSLEVHHIDENHFNNVPSNLITLCESCHQRVHNKNLLFAIPDTVVSIEYVGCIPVFDIEMDSPYHNFVANGVVVHNCNYSKDKFGGDVTYILPLYLKRGSILFNNLEEGLKADEEFQKLLNDPESKWAPTVFDYINFKYGGPGGMNEKSWDDICKFYNYMSVADYSSMSYRASVGRLEEKTLTYNVESTPEEARWMLPLGLATKIVVTANYREWRHIFKLRCEKHAHPEMRRIMCALWLVLNTQIPVIFDDIRDMVNDYLDDDQGLMNGFVATDCVNIGLRYFRKPTIKE